MEGNCHNIGEHRTGQGINDADPSAVHEHIISKPDVGQNDQQEKGESQFRSDLGSHEKDDGYQQDYENNVD
jgi:hypothetical protein